MPILTEDTYTDAYAFPEHTQPTESTLFDSVDSVERANLEEPWLDDESAQDSSAYPSSSSSAVTTADLVIS